MRFSWLLEDAQLLNQQTRARSFIMTCPTGPEWERQTSVSRWRGGVKCVCVCVCVCVWERERERERERDFGLSFRVSEIVSYAHYRLYSPYCMLMNYYGSGFTFPFKGIFRPKMKTVSLHIFTLKNKGASRCHKITFLSKWFHKEPLTSQEDLEMLK